MKRVCSNLACFAVVMVLIISPVNSSGQQVQLDISLSDTSFSVCQSIWLDVQLTNMSADTARVWGFCFPCGGSLNILVTNERGDTLKPNLIRDVEMGSGFLLNPKGVCYDCVDLTEVFHNHELQISSPLSIFRSLAPGKYEVNAECNISNQKIKSPKIPFEVIEPTGNNAEVFKLLYMKAYQASLEKDYQSLNEKLIRIINSYSKSVYAERAYWKLKKYNELLEKFPDSGFNLTSLESLTNKMSKEQKNHFLEKVLKDHPGTRSAKFAQQLLRGW